MPQSLGLKLTSHSSPFPLKLVADQGKVNRFELQAEDAGFFVKYKYYLFNLEIEMPKHRSFPLFFPLLKYAFN